MNMLLLYMYRLLRIQFFLNNVIHVSLVQINSHTFMNCEVINAGTYAAVEKYSISRCSNIKGVTIRYPHDTIRIAILESRYDTYRDTL